MKLTTLGLCLMLWPGTATSEGVAEGLALEAFHQANSAYLNGQYEAAIAQYHKALEARGHHPDLFYNLANSYARAGRKGLAVLYYEKTLALDPDDTDARTNLAGLEKELVDRLVMPEGPSVGEPLWHDFVRRLALGGVTIAFFVCYLAGCGILIARLFVRRGLWRRVLFWLNVPLLSLALSFGLILFGRLYVQENIPYSVVIAPVSALREGPDKSAKALLEVHEGLKLRHLGESNGFSRVILRNGVEGFVAQEALGAI